MARSISRGLLAVALTLGGLLTASSASAQAPGSLGGFGAAPSVAGPTMGGSSPMIIPFGGTFEGFMPSRMGGGSALAFRPRSAAAMGSARTSLRLAPMSGGMGGEPSARSRAMSALGGGGMGLGGGAGLGGMPRRSVPGGASVMPPSIGYPFRQPPSLLSPAATGAGMSM